MKIMTDYNKLRYMFFSLRNLEAFIDYDLIAYTVCLASNNLVTRIVYFKTCLQLSSKDISTLMVLTNGGRN